MTTPAALASGYELAPAVERGLAAAEVTRLAGMAGIADPMWAHTHGTDAALVHAAACLLDARRAAFALTTAAGRIRHGGDTLATFRRGYLATARRAVRAYLAGKRA